MAKRTFPQWRRANVRGASPLLGADGGAAGDILRNLYFDDQRFSKSSPYTRLLKWNDGVGFLPKALKRWNGQTWQEHQVRYWDGSAWLPVDPTAVRVRSILKANNVGTPGTVIDEVGELTWTLSGSGTQSASRPRLGGAGAFGFELSPTGLLESSPVTLDGPWAALFWVNTTASLSGQSWVINYGEKDTAGSFTLIISPGSFATLVPWIGGGSADPDIGFTSTAADYNKTTSGGGGFVAIQHDGTNLQYGIEQADGSVKLLGSAPFTMVPGHRFTFGACPTTSARNAWTGDYDGAVDSFRLQDRGVWSETWPFPAPTSEFSV